MAKSEQAAPVIARCAGARARCLVCCLVAAVIGTCLAEPAPVLAGPPAGSLVQLEGSAGCINNDPASRRCAFAASLEFDAAIVVSPDGRNVYVGSSQGGHRGSVTAFSRDPATGALAQLGGMDGCVSQIPGLGCQLVARLASPSAMAMSPDGRFLYVATSNELLLPARLAVFERNVATGSLRWLACSGERNVGCSPWGSSGPGAMAITPNGAQMLVLALPQRLTVFDRNRRTGLIRRHRGRGACVTARFRRGCVRAHGPFPWELAVTPDGRNVIGLAGDQDCSGPECFDGGDGSLTVFARSAAGDLRQLAGRAGCLSWQRHPGCARARALESANGLAVSPDGRSVYVASFSFASDHDGIAILRRNRASGVLRQLGGKAGCIAKRAVEGCARGRALDNPLNVAVSPDGRNVYSVQNFSNGLAVFRRGRRGALRQLKGPYGCITQRGQQGCARGEGLWGAEQLAISADGKHVYTASDNSLGSLTAFRRVALEAAGLRE